MNYPPQSEQTPRQHMPALKVIGTVLLIMVLICGGLVMYGVYQFRGWASALARGPMVSIIDQSELPDAQKADIKQNIGRVADAFQQGRMSYSQLKAIFQKLQAGPFFYFIFVENVRYLYTAAHPNIDEDRRRTVLALDRFERGIAENQIPPQKVSEIMSLLPHLPEQKTGQDRHSITEADLKPVIDAMRAAADAVAIPKMPFQPDFAAEVNKAISAVLEPAATRPAATTPATSTPSTSAPASRAVLRPVDVISRAAFNRHGGLSARAA